MSKGDRFDETVSEDTTNHSEDDKDIVEISTDDTKQIETLNNESESGSIIDPEPYLKHQLQNCWALWFFKNERGKDWMDCLRLVTSFSTVEDFWAVYNHIQPAGNLQQGSDYSLFKEGIQPMWEDEANRKGGKWTVSVSKQQRNSELDKIWLETMLCLIGEGFGDDSDFVNGAVVSLRPKGDRTSVWTTDYKNVESILKIGKVYKEKLKLPKKMTIGYQSHDYSMHKNSSNVKNVFTI